MEPLYPREPKKIIEAAFKTIGLERVVVSPLDAFDDISATSWFTLCSLLHLSPDSYCYGYGYCRREHKARIRTAWEMGELYLPRTHGLKMLLSEIAVDRARDRRWRDDHYGFRLRWKVRYQDFKIELRLLPKRLATEVQVRLRYPRIPRLDWELPRELAESAS